MCKKFHSGNHLFCKMQKRDSALNLCKVSDFRQAYTRHIFTDKIVLRSQPEHSNLNPSSFVALVALLYFFCKPVVFDYEGTFIATVKAFPNGRAIKDKKIDVCGTAFWTELPSPQESLLFLGSLDRFLEVPLLFP